MHGKIQILKMAQADKSSKNAVILNLSYKQVVCSYPHQKIWNPALINFQPMQNP